MNCLKLSGTSTSCEIFTLDASQTHPKFPLPGFAIMPSESDIIPTNPL